MPTARRPATHPTLQRDVLWLLALVVAVQVVAAGFLATRGPAHVHTGAVDAPALIDVRRAVPAPMPLPMEALHSARSAPGHAAAGAVARHHHAAADTSVVHTGDDEDLRALDAGDGVSFTSIPALLPSVGSWQAPDRGDERAWAPSWAPRTGYTLPLERPPKAG